MADKTKTIKNATDKELDELLSRLRKENEVQDLVRNLKVKALPNPDGSYPNYERYEGISTETPISDLYHAGILGMKWGVRRSPEQLAARSAKKQEKRLAKADIKFGKESNVKNLTVKLTNQLYEKPEFTKELNSLAEGIQKKYSKFDNQDLSDKMLQRGYCDLCEKYLKDDPASYSPSKTARVTWATLEPEGGRGQTYLKPVLVMAEVKHSSDEFDIGFTGKFKVLPDGTLKLIEDVVSDSVEHTDIDAYLEHVGILGMKWGVRRARGSDGRVKGGSKGSADHLEAKVLKKKGYKNLSNKELQDLTKRMQLEQSFRTLKSSDQQKGLDFVKTITGVGTTLATAYALSQTPLAKDVAKAVKNKFSKG